VPARQSVISATTEQNVGTEKARKLIVALLARETGGR
jgi:hypothetical protein